MRQEYIGPAITFVSALVVAFVSFLLKRFLTCIDGIDSRLTNIDAVMHAKIHSIDQTTQARIASVEQVYDAKIRELNLTNISKLDGLFRLVIEHATESDRKYATVRELSAVQERLLAIDNNVRTALAVLERLVTYSSGKGVAP